MHLKKVFSSDAVAAVAAVTAAAIGVESRSILFSTENPNLEMAYGDKSQCMIESIKNSAYNGRGSLWPKSEIFPIF
jgi:hypothetical protein